MCSDDSFIKHSHFADVMGRFKVSMMKIHLFYWIINIIIFILARL